MELVTHRTHVYAVTLFLSGLLSTPSVRSVEDLAVSLIAIYLVVILCQQTVRAGRNLWLESRGGSAE